MFATQMSTIPYLVSGLPTLNVVPTGGSGGDRTQNLVSRPSYLKPSASITVRAGTYEQAYDMAQAAFDACTGVRNQFINSGWYLWLRPVQSQPYPLGPDGREQVMVRFNVNAYMRRKD
jgi:hypothetical protein